MNNSSAFWGSGNQGLYEVQSEDNIADLVAEYDASIVFQYNSKAASKRVNGLLDKVKNRVEALLEHEEHMDVGSLGWFKVDLDEQPNTELPKPDIIYIAHQTFFIFDVFASITSSETDE